MDKQEGGDATSDLLRKERDRFINGHTSNQDLKKFQDGVPDNATDDAFLDPPNKLAGYCAGSVIYGVSCHHKAHTTLNTFRTPWIPSPCKTTPAPNAANSKSPLGFAIAKKNGPVSSTSCSPVAFNSPKKTNRPSFSNPSVVASFPINRTKTRSRKTRKSRPLPPHMEKIETTVESTRYRLSPTQQAHGSRRMSKESAKNKDSLADITTFLEKKRSDIVKLWENNLAQGSSELLSTLEMANKLATEAATEVEELRLSIQGLHDKESSLSEEDHEVLEQLKSRVLKKIEDFEQINSFLQEKVGEITDDKKQTYSVPGPTYAPTIDESSESDNSETTGRTFTYYAANKKQSIQKQAITRLPKEDKETQIDNHADKREEESFPNHYGIKFFEPVNNKKSLPNPGSSFESVKFYKPERKGTPEKPNSGQLEQQIGRLIEALNVHKVPLTVEEEDTITTVSSTTDSVKCYKSFAKQLGHTETEIAELKEQMQRVESDSNWQMERLKARYEDRLENLEILPGLLVDMEERLSEALKSNASLEKLVQEKNSAIDGLKRQLYEKLGPPPGTGELKMTTDENVARLQKSIQDLIKMHSDKPRAQSQENVPGACQSQSGISLRGTSLLQVQDSAADASSNKELVELKKDHRKLLRKYSILKEYLSKANTNVRALKAAKETMEVRLKERQNDLLKELEEVRRYNQHLQHRLHNVRVTYKELFGEEGSKFKPKKTTYQTNRPHTSHDEFNEAFIEPSTAWVTGEGEEGSKYLDKNESGEDEEWEDVNVMDKSIKLKKKKVH